MIKIKDRIDEDCYALLFCPDHEYIGCIDNYLSLLDVRVQIKKMNKPGYYLNATVRDEFGKTMEYKIDISATGKLSDCPNGFFDVATNMLIELIS